MRPDRLITTSGFLNRIIEQHQRRKDRPFCFILGAGASRASGIDTGSEMAREWLDQLHEEEDLDQLPLEKWATAENLGIEEFDLANLGLFYPEIYARRFADSPEAGYAFLEDKMQGKEPSFGYSILAYLLSATQHKVVITTNFDNLVADALSIHSTTFPIVVGHDALASYAQVDLRRPLIAKVHGGLGFAMKSSPADLQALSVTWKKSLHRIFERYSPIVIGYDGNDGSLMTFLEEMDDGIIDGLYWCFHCPSEDVTSSYDVIPQRVKDLVEKKHGRLVPIPGFDEIMLLIRERFSSVIQMPDLLDQMCVRAREREKAYDEQQRTLTAKLNAPSRESHSVKRVTTESPSPKTNLNQMLIEAAKDLTRERKAKPWWAWENEAALATTVEDKEQIYQAALAALPQSSELMSNYAIFLKREGKDLDKAENFFKRAIEADTTDADYLGNYAVFLKDARRDPDKAEEFYKRAIEANPNHANNLGNYANFLYDERKNLDKAEEYYKRAIEADPHHATSVGNYAVFLYNERKDLDKAEEFYKRAIEIDPNHATNLGNYAVFLYNERKDLDKAEKFYKRAIEADPNHANNLGNYAIFLKSVRKNLDKAEEFYKRAIEIDPNHATNLCNYAVFLYNERKDLDKTEEFYKRAIEADPSHANSLGNYAVFLYNERKDLDKAEEFYKRAIEADPNHVNNLSNYAQWCFLRQQHKEGKQLLEEVMKLSPKAPTLLAELAFYHLAHVPESWPHRLLEIHRLLRDGARSPGWPLLENVRIAREAGHPNPELLEAIAEVISHNAPIDNLAEYSEWPQDK